MKKLGIIISVAVIAVIGISIIVSGQKRYEETVQEVIMQFYKNISSKSYAKAYDVLDDESKLKISEKKFEQMHKELIDYLQIKDIVMGTMEVYPNNLYTVCRFNATFKSELREDIDKKYSIELEKELGKWKIKWSPQLIFPEMDWGSSLKVKRMAPMRGEIFAGKDIAASNINGITVYVEPSRIADWSNFAQEVAPLVSMDEQSIERILKRTTLQGVLMGTGRLRSAPILDSEQGKVIRDLFRNDVIEVLDDGKIYESQPPKEDEGVKKKKAKEDKQESEEKKTLFYHVKFNDGESDIEGYIATEFVRLKYSQDILVLNSFTPSAIDEKTRQMLLDIPGIGIDTDQYKYYRTYPFGESLMHVIGYVSEISKEELKEKEAAGDKSYKSGDYIGKAGLEKIFEKELRGNVGYEVFVSNEGEAKGEVLYNQPAIDGQDIYLTVDPKLQTRAYDMLRMYLKQDQAGAIVCIDPQTGAVKAIASYPSVDPSLFFNMTPAIWSQLQSNTLTPLFDRATNGAYVPGSVFKPFTAAIGMESGAISSNSIFPYPDQIEADKWKPLAEDWNTPWNYPEIKRVENVGRSDETNFSNAMAYSDNIYFAWTAMRIGAEKFTNYCNDVLGFNDKVPFDLNVAKASIFKPSANFPDFNIKFLADSGYGQGEMIITPLHMAALYAGIANGGDVMAPYIVDKRMHTEGTVYIEDYAAKTTVWKENIMGTDYIDSVIEQSLKGVMEYGTGKKVQHSYEVAGKTGTAEKDKQHDIAWMATYKTESPRDFCAVIAIECATNEGEAKYNIMSSLLKYDAEEKKAAAQSDEDESISQEPIH